MPSFLLQTKANVLTALMQTVECHSRRLQGWRKWHGSFFFHDNYQSEDIMSFPFGSLLLFHRQNPPPPSLSETAKWWFFCLIFDRAHIDVKALHWMIIISLPKWKGRWAILLTLVARTLDENNLEMLVWMEIIFTCKQYFPDWSTLMCKLRIKWLFGRLSSW